MLYYDTQRNTATTRPRREGMYYPCRPSTESFPPGVTLDTLKRHGFYPAQDVKPDHNPEKEKPVPTGWTKDGDTYVRQYEIQPLPEDEVAATMRAKRDALLTESDCRVLPDYPHATDNDYQAWVSYRQALRDVPQQEGFPYSIAWPTEPE